MHHVTHGIAPYNLLQRDFRILDASERLRTTWDIERLILLQSVQGHAHEGHAAFHGSKYPNTSMDDIARALRLDPVWVRTARQRLIDEIKEYVRRAIAGEDHLRLVNEEGVGFLGSSMFLNIEVPAHDVLRGLFLGGLRDNPKYRFAMEERYGITIGGGQCYLIDTEVMDNMGLNEEILAHGSHEDMIDFYKEKGLIVRDSGPDDGNLEYVYIRHRRGLGASDDTAILAAGLIYGYGTAVGCFLADAVDTLEKYVPIFSDQDEDIAEDIRDNYKSLDVSDADVHHLAYLSATPEHAKIDVPDSSLRHLLQIDSKHDMTPIESHLLFIRGRIYAPLRLGHDDVLNKDLYSYVKDRIRSSPGPV